MNINKEKRMTERTKLAIHGAALGTSVGTDNWSSYNNIAISTV